jgi:hypothetical protein
VNDLPSGVLHTSLRTLGLGPGEVLSIGGPVGKRHFEIIRQASSANEHPEPWNTPINPPLSTGKEKGGRSEVQQ